MSKHTFSILPLILALFLVATSNGQNFEKLKVLILYESLCPDSMRFMGNQLGPNYNVLQDLIDISLVPFGKSQSKDNGDKFFCQHGPLECYGNRQQSCVLRQTKHQPTQVNFAVCQMTISNNSSIDFCAERVGLSKNIGSCMNTELGTFLQLEAERITRSYEPSFVPTIIYDGVFDQQLQDDSLYDFRGTVCSILQKKYTASFNDAACQ